MYDGWMNLVGPAIVSGMVVLAAWTIPRLVTPRSLEFERHGKDTLHES